MKDRLLSILIGAVGGFGTSSALGIITDVIIALGIAFLGGVLGYFGNEAAKYLHKKLKRK